MADTDLNTGTSGGAQNDTGNPQTATPFAGAAANSASVQPGTSNSILTSPNGVPLTSPSVTSLNLSTSTAQTAAASPQPQHHSNVLSGLSILLFLVAVVLFYTTFRKAKNTTK